MGEISADQLKKAVESRHGCKATFVQSVPVHERQEDHTVWRGQVSVFDLRFSSSGAFRCYAWWRELPDGGSQIIHDFAFTRDYQPRPSCKVGDPRRHQVDV